MTADENTLKITPNGAVLREVNGEWVVISGTTPTEAELASAVTATFTTLDGSVMDDATALNAANGLLSGSYTVDGVYFPTDITLADGTTQTLNKDNPVPLADVVASAPPSTPTTPSIDTQDITLNIPNAFSYDIDAALAQINDGSNLAALDGLATQLDTLAYDWTTAVFASDKVDALKDAAKLTWATSRILQDPTLSAAEREALVKGTGIVFAMLNASINGESVPTPSEADMRSLAVVALTAVDRLSPEEAQSLLDLLPADGPWTQTLEIMIRHRDAIKAADPESFSAIARALAEEEDDPQALAAAIMPHLRSIAQTLPEADRTALLDTFNQAIPASLFTSLVGEDAQAKALLQTILNDALTNPDPALFTQLNSLVATNPLNMGAALDVVTTWAQQSPENAAQLPQLASWVSNQLPATPEGLRTAASPVITDMLAHLSDLTPEEQHALAGMFDGTTSNTTAQMVEVLQEVYIHKPARDLAAAALPVEVSTFELTPEVQALLSRYSTGQTSYDERLAEVNRIINSRDQDAYVEWLEEMRAAIDAETTGRQTLITDTITQAGGEALQALNNIPEPFRGFVLALAELFRPLLPPEMQAGLDILNRTSNQTAAEIRAEEAALGGQFPIPDSALMDASSAEAVAANAANDNAIAPEAVPTVTAAIPAPTTLAPVVQQAVAYNPEDYLCGITPEMAANDHPWCLSAGQNISVANLGQLTPTLTPTIGLPRTRDQQLMAA